MGGVEHPDVPELGVPGVTPVPTVARDHLGSQVLLGPVEDVNHKQVLVEPPVFSDTRPPPLFL